jgi:hypothetical protein
MAKQWVMGSLYRIVQERKPPTAKQLQRLEDWRKAMPDQDQERYDCEVMQELWHIQFGTADEAEGDFRHDVQRQQELDDKET